MKMMKTPSNTLEGQLAHLPHQPGVYLMKNRHGTVLYIGKAVLLTHRVRSYFQKGAPLSVKTRAMIEQLESIETIVTGSELEALLLENNLIKKYRPKYNVILRDDKNYPLLRLPIADDYPRLERVRRVKQDGALYFGPYIPSNGLNEMIRLLRRIFPLPNCTIKIDGHAERPCIEYEIKRCLAPCTGYQSKAAYHEMIQQVRMFLEGKDNRLIKQLQHAMREYSANLNFEEAARIRDQIAKIKRALERQRITSSRQEDQDVLAVFRNEDTAVIAVLFIRGGMVLGKKAFFFEKAEADSDDTLLSAFLQQFYQKDRVIPKRVILPIPISDQPLLQQWLSEQCGHTVRLVSPARGAARGLINLTTENARVLLESHLQTEETADAVLHDLQRFLNLSRFPNRIEGYDISNIMGTSAVGSQVVFEGGIAKKSDYRHFKIKTIDQANDFGMMAEILTRRIKRLQGHPEKRPDLILIDGGKGQVSAARAVLEAAGLGGIDLIGLAKERDDHPERVYKPDCSDPILLSERSPTTHLLMRIRDEAHRFAITYHRKVRSRKMLSSHP